MTGKDSDKDGRKRPDHQDEDAVADLAYEPSVNQTAHHPMPASRDDDTGQAAVRENEEHWRRSHGRARSVRNDAERGKAGSASQAVPARRRAPRKDRPASDRDQEDRK
ncbi:MAG TPA: hypothetical protein VGQ05_04695 [Streptosporangiaceae bacterium]|jgi:hypothetical protein|nr:hypothetical protein [Streptosporangiaceae bacterium]